MLVRPGRLGWLVCNAGDWVTRMPFSLPNSLPQQCWMLAGGAGAMEARGRRLMHSWKTRSMLVYRVESLVLS